jgi:hypothetical protein
MDKALTKAQENVYTLVLRADALALRATKQYSENIAKAPKHQRQSQNEKIFHEIL